MLPAQKLDDPLRLMLGITEMELVPTPTAYHALATACASAEHTPYKSAAALIE